MTKNWLYQLILGLVLICHSSYRKVVELLRDLFDTSVSIGAVHDRLEAAPYSSRSLQALVEPSQPLFGSNYLYWSENLIVGEMQGLEASANSPLQLAIRRENALRLFPALQSA